MGERDCLQGAQADLVRDRADARFVEMGFCAQQGGRAGGKCRAGCQKFSPCHEMIVVEIGMDWTSPNGRKIELREGDITRIAVDAMANAANSALAGGGGVDGAIHRAGGPSIMRELDAIRKSQGGCPTGSAVATGAGNLPAKWVFHAVGPVYREGRDDAALLAGCYRKCLELAEERAVKTISFPAISTGVYGY